MPSIHDLIPSRYIKKDDLGANEAALCTIRSLTRENVGTQDEPAEKVVIGLDEFDKSFVANITNVYAIAAIYGDDYGEWIGKKIVIYFDPSVLFKGKVTGGMRVRAPKGTVQEAKQDLPF
jgi:hypothetical protein